jgi:hypothetical protein
MDEKHMNVKLPKVAILVLITLLFAGCRTSPIYNVHDARYTSPPSNVTEQDVAEAIIAAGRGLGWIMKEKEPGHILATLHLRSHKAVVDIHYDRDSYDITYKDSANLKYDGTNIHTNYNGWIENLENAINANVSNL